MADLTQKIDLTSTWQEVPALTFIGQIEEGIVMELSNADTGILPTPSSPVLTVTTREILIHRAPKVGVWYARVNEGVGTLSLVEV